MSLRTRISGIVIGVVALVWAVVGPYVVPSARLTATECWIGGIAGALIIVGSLWRWRCMKCHGAGEGPDAVLTPAGDIALVTATCDWCGGDGKGRQL